MDMDSRVIEVAGFKSEAIFIALLLARLYGHCPLVMLVFLKGWVGVSE